MFTKEFVDRKLTAELEGLGTPLQSLLNMDIVRLTRHFFMDMVTTKADAQNRVQLTPEHRQFAGIEDEVVICGCGNYIELWSPEALEKYKAEQGGVDKIVASAEALIPIDSQRGSGERSAILPQGGSG